MKSDKLRANTRKKILDDLGRGRISVICSSLSEDMKLTIVSISALNSTKILKPKAAEFSKL